MLAYAQRQQGKPFSMWAMTRSVLWPRKTTERDYFCAELVAQTLKVGGLMSGDSNPGAATPESLWRMYSRHAATTGNPCTMRSLTHERTTPEEVQPLLRGRRFLPSIMPVVRAATAPLRVLGGGASRVDVEAGRQYHPSSPPPQALAPNAYARQPHGSMRLPAAALSSRMGTPTTSVASRDISLLRCHPCAPTRGATESWIYRASSVPPLDLPPVRVAPTNGGVGRGRDPTVSAAEMQIRQAVRGINLGSVDHPYSAVGLFAPISAAHPRGGLHAA